MVDLMEVFTGHRSITRQGNYEMFDAPIGVNLRVEPGDKSDPFMLPEKEWETDDIIYPGHIWHQAAPRRATSHALQCWRTNLSCRQ